MNFMGIGAPEIMVIAVIALLVFGPSKLPEVMGQAGKMVRDFRRMSAELSGEFEKTIAEAKNATGGLAAELGGMSKEVNSITNSVKKDLGVKTTGSRTTTGTKANAGKSATASKTSSTSKSSTASKSTTSSTNKTGSKAGSTTAAKATSTTTATKKPATPVASKEDPTADVFLFEPKPVERAKRSRKAVPSIISDPTPRVSDILANDDPEADLVAATSGSANDDALSRARQRRRNAGYARPAV